MDEATRKELETCLRTLLREASRIRQLLDGDTTKRVVACNLQNASIAGIMTTEILQKPADTQSAHD